MKVLSDAFGALPVLMAALCLCSPAVARLEMRIEPPPGGMEIGRPFHLYVEASEVAPERLRFPALPDLGPDLKVLAHDAPASRRAAGRRYRVLPLASGPLEIPPVEAVTGGGRVLRSNRVAIAVRPPAASGDGGLAVPDLLWTPPERRESPLIPILLASALALAGLAGWFVYRRRRSVAVADPPPSPETAALDALDALERKALEGGALNTWADYDRYYVTLSRIVKGFLVHAFDLPALERTTSELEVDLAGTSAPLKAQAQLVVPLLEDCDEMKFGTHGLNLPDRGRAAEDLDRARRFVSALSGGGEEGGAP